MYNNFSELENDRNFYKDLLGVIHALSNVNTLVPYYAFWKKEEHITASIGFLQKAWETADTYLGFYDLSFPADKELTAIEYEFKHETPADDIDDNASSIMEIVTNIIVSLTDTDDEPCTVHELIEDLYDVPWSESIAHYLVILRLRLELLYKQIKDKTK